LLGHYRHPHEFSSEEFAELVETGYGMKSRLHPLAAAIGVVSLKNIGFVCEQRDANYRLLASLVEPIPGLAVLGTPSNCTRGGYFRFVLKFDPDLFAGLTATQVVDAIVAEGALEVRSGAQARCLHSFRIFQDRTFSVFGREWLAGSDPLAKRPLYRLGDFPNAEAFAANTIQIPAFTPLSQDLLGQYVQALAKVQAYANHL
jgi:dTDP-4-amino-4,6-dideoxygalactose transaminase